MAYTPLTNAEIEAGKPTKEELFTKIQNNENYFDAQIQLLQGNSNFDIFDFTVSGYPDVGYSNAQVNERMPVFKAPIAGTIISFTMTLLEASTSGTLGVEIFKSIDDGVNWVPLLSSEVQLTGTTVGSVSGAVNWVDVPSQSFAQNDLLKIEINTLQTNQGTFHISVYGELS